MGSNSQMDSRGEVNVQMVGPPSAYASRDKLFATWCYDGRVIGEPWDVLYLRKIARPEQSFEVASPVNNLLLAICAWFDDEFAFREK